MNDDAIVSSWDTWARGHLESRGLAAVVPVLEGFARAARSLRRADWNPGADGRDGTPAPEQEGRG
jgi:hypothetical protein